MIIENSVLVSATNYVNANDGTMSGCLGDIKNFLKNGNLDQVVAIVKSCSSNVSGDLTVTMKNLSGTTPRTIHHKVIGEGGYGKDIKIEAALKTNQNNPPTPEKPHMPPMSSFPMGGSSSQQCTHQPMSPNSSHRTVDESVEEHDIGDEYLTEVNLTKKEQPQLLLYEETLRETFEEETKAEKERSRVEKEWEERMKEQAHDELFRSEFGVQSDSEYETD
nr:hypothetical protein [Tanacetum cinerariifolium]